MTDNTRIPKLVGIGLIAGLVGTIVMTLGQKAEMAATGREPSNVPAEAVEQLTGTDLQGEQREAQLSTATHFAYGTALGATLAALDDVPLAARIPAFLAGTWAVGQAIEVGLGVAKPPTQQEPSALAIDIGHHVVYAVVSVGAYALLRRVAVDHDLIAD